jgi:hypothetical protein
MTLTSFRVTANRSPQLANRFLSSAFLANQATNAMAIVPNAEHSPINDAAGWNQHHTLKTPFHLTGWLSMQNQIQQQRLVLVEF